MGSHGRTAAIRSCSQFRVKYPGIDWTTTLVHPFGVNEVADETLLTLPARQGQSAGIAFPAMTGGVRLLVFAVFLFGCASSQLHSILHHDPAWLIHGTKIFLDGGKLYRDVFELNPPLIFYLTVAPVWVARQLHLFEVDVFVLYVFALIALSLWVSWLLSRDDTALPSRTRDCMLIAAAVALALCPADNFGQREHIMVVLSLPYLLLAVRRARSLPCLQCLALATGAMAAFGFALKPHFMLIPFAVECYIILRTRTARRILRTETMALGALVLLYLAVIALFTPDYLTTIVPFGLAVYEGGFDSPLLAVLACPATLLLPILLALHIASRRSHVGTEHGDVFCVAAVCFFVVYAVQMKGWSYQAYPVNATLFLGIAIVFARLLNAPRLPLLTVAVALLLVLTVANDGSRRYRNAFMTEMAPLVTALPPGSSIYVFTAQVSEAFPMVNYAGVGWSSRFDTFWLLPGLVRQPAPSREIEQFMRDAVVEDLTRQPPALIFVDVARYKVYFGDRDFDYISYFSADPRFATIWTGYQPLTRAGHFLVFRQRVSGTAL